MHGASVNIRGEIGEDVLAMVVRHTDFNPRLVKILLREKKFRPLYDCSLDVCHRQSLWEQAFYMRNPRLIRALLDAGLDPSGPDHPLVEAVSDGDVLATKMLLDAGADANYRNSDGQSVLSSAITANYGVDTLAVERKERSAIVRLLRQHGANAFVRDAHNETAIDIARRNDCEYLFSNLRSERRQPLGGRSRRK